MTASKITLLKEGEIKLLKKKMQTALMSLSVCEAGVTESLRGKKTVVQNFAFNLNKNS